MAPFTGLANQIDLDEINKADIKQAYWALFQEMMKDFITIEDLGVILTGNLVDTKVKVDSFTGVGVGIGSAAFNISTGQARTKAILYKNYLETGAVVREELVEMAEKTTS